MNQIIGGVILFTCGILFFSGKLKGVRARLLALFNLFMGISAFLSVGPGLGYAFVQGSLQIFVFVCLAAEIRREQKFLKRRRQIGRAARMKRLHCAQIEKTSPYFKAG